MTYEGAYSIIGPFFKELGMSAVQVGLISGAGEMIAASLRFFSGRFADRTRAYWPIVFTGYGINIFVIPALAFVGNWPAAAMLVAAERNRQGAAGPARERAAVGGDEGGRPRLRLRHPQRDGPDRRRAGPADHGVDGDADPPLRPGGSSCWWFPPCWAFVALCRGARGEPDEGERLRRRRRSRSTCRRSSAST